MTASPRSCPGPDGRPTNPFEPFPRADLDGALTAPFARQVACQPTRLAVKMGWSSICRHVETHSVPGDHLGAITRHIGATGERLRACLERALPS